MHAVDGVSLEVRPGETLGLVGESGCGKSTLGRCIVRLYELTGGTIIFEGRDISKLSRRELQPLRRQMQMVFQDPYASLNPRKRVGTIIADPLRIHNMGDRAEVKRRVSELLRARRALARSTTTAIRTSSRAASGSASASPARSPLHPKLIVADEPVSALDVSIQAQVINLLDDLQDELRPHLPLHRARPRRRAPRLRPHRGDVPGQDRRDLAGRGALPRSRCTPTPRRCSRRCRSPTPTCRPPRADRARGRRAQPDRAAVGLPLPPALPVRDRDLRPRGAAARPARHRRPPGRLPPPARRRGRRQWLAAARLCLTAPDGVRSLLVRRGRSASCSWRSSLPAARAAGRRPRSRRDDRASARVRRGAGGGRPTTCAPATGAFRSRSCVCTSTRLHAQRAGLRPCLRPRRRGSAGRRARRGWRSASARS